MTFKFYLRMVAAAMTVLFMAVGCSDDKTDDPPVNPPVDPTVNCTFEIEVYDTTDAATFVKAHPSDATVTYQMGVAKKSLYDTFASDKAFQTDDVEMLKSEAEKLSMTISDYLLKRIFVGDVPFRFTDLEPSTEYYAYVYGITPNGDVTTDITKKEFTTEALSVPMTFEITVSGITPYGATVAVKPSAKGTYYYDVIEKAEMDKFGDNAAAVIAELEKNPEFTKGLVTGDQSHTYKEGTDALKPKTEYYAYAFEYGNPNIEAPKITKKTFTTKSDDPFNPTYESWLGKWKVTSSSSMKGNRPLEFEIEINQKVAGVSYTVKNWGITPWASEVVVEARYHGTADEIHEKGSLSFANQQSFGALDETSPAYDIMFINYYDNGGKPMIVTGSYNDFTGVLTSEDSGKMDLYDLELKNAAGDTFTRTMIGADIFGLDMAKGEFGTYNPVKAYEELGYPVGPYTLTWVGEVDNPDPGGEAPTLELTAVAGNGQGGETESKVSVMAKSSGATSGRYGLFNKAAVDGLLAEGNTLEAIIAQNGNPISAERLAKMNSAEGLGLTFIELDPGTEWIAIYSASNEFGTTVDSAVASTTSSQVEPSDLTLTIEIDAQTQIPGGVHATVTASNATDKWLPVFLLANEVEGLSDANLIKGIEKMFGGNISRALTTGNLETTAANFAGKNALIPGADYYLVAFGHTGVGATTSVFKQKFTAGAGPEAAGTTFTINVTDITATGAKLAVAASKEPVIYMADVFKQDAFTQMGGAAGLAKYYQDMFAYYATEGYSTLAVIQAFGAWYSGYEYAYDTLDSNTTYIPTAICMDLSGNVIGTATVGASFTTPEPDPSQVVTATSSYSKYYDGDDVAANGGSANAAGNAFVPTTVTKSANAAHFISGLFSGDYTDPASVTDAVIIQNLEANFMSMLDKAQTNWLAAWDTKCTFFAVATDAAGKYGPVHRLGGLFTKSGVSPITDLLGAPAQRSTLTKRPYLCSSMLPELVVPMIFRPIESGLLSVTVIEPRSSQVRQTLEVSDLKAFEAVDSDVLSNGLMTLGKPMRYMVAADVQTGTVKNVLRPVKKVEAAFKLGVVRNE